MQYLWISILALTYSPEKKHKQIKFILCFYLVTGAEKGEERERMYERVKRGYKVCKYAAAVDIMCKHFRTFVCSCYILAKFSEKEV